MSRLLFWIAFIVLVIMALRSKLSAASRPDAHRSTRPKPAPQVESEPMTSCGQCGIYFPASEAVHAGGHDYCCAAHAGQASH